MSDTNVTKMAGVRYLSFTLGNEGYAIPLLSVREVIAMPETTKIPGTPPYFLGIMNLRGQVISVVDLRAKYQIKPKEAGETAVIICDLSPVCIGVVVDSINFVFQPSETEVSGPPELPGSKHSESIMGVYRKDKELVLFLDIAKALNVEDYTALKAAANSAASTAKAA